jgi:AraC-like DNA-binding protein
LKTEKQEFYVTDNFVSYVPSRLEYSRRSKKDELIVIHFETTNYNTKNIECFESVSPERLRELFQSILDCWNKKEIGYKFRCSAILCEIFEECYKQNYRSGEKNSKIEASVRYINQNYKNSELTIKELSEKSYMSEVYFRKLFKEEFGVSPQRYIIDLRIQYAAGLISTGYYSLKEIAYMSGYNDYKYFSVEFKKIMGVSPSEYMYNYKE